MVGPMPGSSFRAAMMTWVWGWGCSGLSNKFKSCLLSLAYMLSNGFRA
jgi:hypothetical protein